MDYSILCKHVKYDHVTGLFFRKKSTGLVVIPVRVTKAGYGFVVIAGKRYMAHRLAHLYVFRWLPKEPLQIDHINRNKLDNRIGNLRVVTPSQNMYNIGMISSNSSGYRGVTQERSKFLALIRYQGVSKRLGLFDTPEEASEAYNLARKELHGEFVNV